MCRVVVRFFKRCPPPHAHISTHLPTPDVATAQQLPTPVDLAFATLAALQLLPELRQAWGSEGPLALLTHLDPTVRWAGVRALTLQLGLVSVGRGCGGPVFLRHAVLVALNQVARHLVQQ